MLEATSCSCVLLRERQKTRKRASLTECFQLICREDRKQTDKETQYLFGGRAQQQHWVTGWRRRCSCNVGESMARSFWRAEPANAAGGPDFEDETFTGTEHTDKPSQKVAERNQYGRNHGLNLIEYPDIKLVPTHSFCECKRFLTKDGSVHHSDASFLRISERKAREGFGSSQA